MASPTLAVRVGILAAVIFGAVATVALVLATLFFIGLTAISPASLAIGVLILITIGAATALALAFAASAIAIGLLAFAVFVVVALVVAPQVGIAAVILFLVVMALALALAGNPLNIPFGLLLLALLLFPFFALGAGILGMGGALVVLSVLGFIALGFAVAWLIFRMHAMPLGLLGLGGLRRMPAVPLASVQDFVEAAIRLKGKEAQRQKPIDALTTVFTLGAGTRRERTANGHTFLFADSEAKQYSLDKPDQFTMGWTTMTQIDQRAAPLAAQFEDALTTAAAGTAAFWPNISRYWNPFGILPITLVTQTDIPRFTALLGRHWDSNVMGPLIQGGSLFVIDMTIFAAMDPPSVQMPRFTPATLAFLVFDKSTPLMPTFTPILIRVSDGSNTQVYRNVPTGLVTNNSWLYALQALKASTTCWGIWLGHVYRYHMVTAAMQMTMYQRLSSRHSVRQVLGLQSKHLIGFDSVLLFDWSFPPPTSCGTSIQFLQLTDAFAAGRNFFADDPETALAALNLPKDDFSNPLFSFADINLPAFAARLNAARTATPITDPVSVSVLASLSIATDGLLAAYGGGEDPALQTALVNDLNALIRGGPLTALVTGAGVALSVDTSTERAAAMPRTIRLNRMLLQDAYPAELWIMQWNLYPIAHYVVSIYRAAARYVGAVVASLYPSVASIAADAQLRRWMQASATQGNVQGLPVPLTTPAQLAAVLTSLIYRITAHGLARLAPVGNPGLTWVGNFPPCLEDSRLPDPLDPTGTGATPAADLTREQLLAFMPKTGTIGEMISFIFSFGFTDPFEPLIPVESANTTGGPDMELHPFIGLPVACDTALQIYRSEITGFIRYFVADANVLNQPAQMNFSATAAAIHQWEMNIEQ